MGKRSNFDRVAKDFYPTPWAVAATLAPHLPSHTVFDEPCAGKRDLIKHLESFGHECARASDITDQHSVDANSIKASAAQMFITNPPWTWAALSPLINHLSSILPTWLLLSADTMHNKRMAPHMDRCSKVVSVGRVKWFNNTAGMENAAWYQFVPFRCNTHFIARVQ